MGERQRQHEWSIEAQPEYGNVCLVHDTGSRVSYHWFTPGLIERTMSRLHAEMKQAVAEIARSSHQNDADAADGRSET